MCSGIDSVKKIDSPVATSHSGSTIRDSACRYLGALSGNRYTGNKNIMVITDYFTKHVITVPLSKLKVAEVAKAFVEKQVLRIGAPATLHTENGT